MSDDPGYRPGGTAGGRCGCAAAALPLLLLGPVWILVMSLGNCAPEYGCHRNQGWDMLVMLATLGSVGALLGLSVRALVNWLALDGRPSGRSPACWPWPPCWTGCSDSGPRRRSSLSRPEEGGPFVR